MCCAYLASWERCISWFLGRAVPIGDLRQLCRLSVLGVLCPLGDMEVLCSLGVLVVP